MSTKMQFNDIESQSVEFYKIKLMEKQSQYTTLEAKVKKLEFKHARQIKETKMEIDKTKDLLKAQKTKYDKLNTTAVEHKEQNNLLQLRLNDLKEQKEKEVDSIKAKYNQIKQQVRQYERILPTHTFITQLGATIDKLPTYEDLFTNLKEKSQMFTQLQAKHNTFKKQMQDKLRVSTKNFDDLNTKKLQLDKNLKDLATRNIEMQNNLFQQKRLTQQIQNKLQKKTNELEEIRVKIQELIEENKLYQEKLNSMFHDHQLELQYKQDQITKITEEQFNKYESEISQLTNNHQQKQEHLVQQLLILEDEVSALQMTNQKQKEKYEQLQNQLRNSLSQLKYKYETITKKYNQLQEKNLEVLQKIGVLANTNEQLENKQIKLEAQIKQYKFHINKYKEAEQQIKKKSLQSIERASKDKQLLAQKLQSLQSQNEKLYQQKKEKQNENILLSHELEDVRVKIQRMSYDKIPEVSGGTYKNSGVQFQQIMIGLRGSFQKSNKSMRSSDNDIIIQTEQFHEQQLNKEKQENKLLQQKNAQLQCRVQQLLYRIKNTEQVLQEIQFENSKEVTNLQQTNKKLQSQITRQMDQIQTTKKKMIFFKESYEKLKAQNDQYMKDNLQGNQNKIKLNREIRDLKTKQDNLKKQQNQLAAMLKLKIEELNKEKAIIQELKSSSSNKQKQLNQQLSAIKLQKEQLEKKCQSYKKNIQQQAERLAANLQQIKKLSENIQNLTVKNTQLEEQLAKKDRQRELISQSLQRERRDRTLRVVPSLQSLHSQQLQQQQNFTKHYNLAGQKQAQIYILQRQIEDFKEQIENMKQKHIMQVQSMQAEQNSYIQQIIAMKLKVAESEMHASEREFLYCKIKKKLDLINEQQLIKQ